MAKKVSVRIDYKTQSCIGLQTVDCVCVASDPHTKHNVHNVKHRLFFISFCTQLPFLHNINTRLVILVSLLLSHLTISLTHLSMLLHFLVAFGSVSCTLCVFTFLCILDNKALQCRVMEQRKAARLVLILSYSERTLDHCSRFLIYGK